MKKPSGRPCRRSPIKARPRPDSPILLRISRGLLGAGLTLILAQPAAAQDRAEARRGELKELQSRIQALQKEIGQAEESKGDVADQLKATEKAISEANRRLHELGATREALQAELAELSAQSRRLESRIAEQKEQLARLLHRQYLAGDADSLRHLLSSQDKDQLARDHYYLSLLSKAKLELIGSLGASLEEKQRLAQAARSKEAELAQIERQQQAQRAELLEQRKKRQTVLASISDKIKLQRKQVERLQRDEKRLARLIAGLSRIVSRPRNPAAPAQPLARNERTPDASLSGEDFAALKGRLRLPAVGELLNRFGTRRDDEGGTTWKGLFIRAAAGSAVKAIAAGRVVFADWLRGFGNLIILDHGDGYLSVYGNNESLLKEVGQSVKGGETIAAIGNSGGNPETGLYFEIRHQGQPLDPMKWVTLK
ncbi:MAG: peptidoglycan DD-metalloendopeptidase family protein [Pseudomonadota bacterium]|jgi:septal ring factor EnvC (AmiA/AmiB activator)